MAEWKDITSYSQHDTERVPQTWQALPGGIELIVTRYVGMDGWFMLCHEYGVRSHQEIRGEDIEDAKVDALRRFRAMAAKAQGKAVVAQREALELMIA